MIADRLFVQVVETLAAQGALVVNDTVVLEDHTAAELLRIVAGVVPARAGLPVTSVTQDIAFLTGDRLLAAVSTGRAFQLSRKRSTSVEAPVYSFARTLEMAVQDDWSDDDLTEAWSLPTVADINCESPSDWTDTSHESWADLLTSEQLPNDTFRRLVAVYVGLLRDAFDTLYPARQVTLTVKVDVRRPAALIDHVITEHESSRWSPDDLDDAVREALILGGDTTDPSVFGVRLRSISSR